MRTYYIPNSLNGYLDKGTAHKNTLFCLPAFFSHFFCFIVALLWYDNCDMLLLGYMILFLTTWLWLELLCSPHAMSRGGKKNKSNVRVDKQNNCLLSNTAVKNCTKWWLMLLQQAVKIRFNFSDILTERSVTFKTRLWKAQSARLVNIYFQGSTL